MDHHFEVLEAKVINSLYGLKIENGLETEKEKTRQHKSRNASTDALGAMIGSAQAAAKTTATKAPGFIRLQAAINTFLGNDFLRECGDVLSSHTVFNPDLRSEVQLLVQYGPDVPTPILERVAAWETSRLL